MKNQKHMNVLAIAGSSSKTSINKQLVSYSAGLFAPAEVNVIDLNDYEVGIFSSDKENENGIPDKIIELSKQIDNSHLLLISLAEHNGSYSAAFKNVYDWLSRIPNRKTFGTVPIFLMATSPGGRGGASVLEIAMARFPREGSKVLDSFSLPSFHDNFKEEITDPIMAIEFKKKINDIKLRHFPMVFPDKSGDCGIDPSKDDCGDAIEY
ncbi:MAG: NADPH-dependent FMN reductase [Salibacteraceae bacterium]